ncbi:VOC family protein [Mesorhizobium australicum]|uniref:VOC family protein n=1 Tax=Mesorhizobium australicum TaxID=536018 RepID=UPI0033358660
MFDHISIGVRDVTASKRFYDAALGPLGFTCVSQSPGSLGYGVKAVAPQAVAQWVNEAARPVPADERSGLHFCFAAPTRDSVVAFHAGALREGASDKGAPGLRADYGENYDAAFVVGPDGYRLEAYCGAAA